jgi:hypothetical protein
MSLFRKDRDDKNPKAESGSGPSRDVRDRNPDQQEKTRDTDEVMEQWKDVPPGKQKSDGSGERG